MAFAFSYLESLIPLGAGIPGVKPALAKKTKRFVIGVSILGGIFHNMGQLAAAAFVTQTSRLAYYFPCF